MILKEGGNVFKGADGVPVTQRINKADVDPTLAWLEKITGIPHKDFKLGSTGIRSTSGDMDIAVNQGEVSKDDLVAKLHAWVQKNKPGEDVKSWVRKSGINVHFKTPINGNEANGFVQTDLMFGNPEFMMFSLRGAGDDTPYKGMHRMLLMASIAKAQGMKWSANKGLLDRETNELITAVPDEIAEKMLGQGARRNDLDSVESIHAKIKGRPDYEALVADAKDAFARDNLALPETVEESLADRQLTRIINSAGVLVK